MILQNNIFGDFDIKEEVLIELINTSAIQRLKNIDQAGYSKGFFKHSRNRYNHSIGVFLVLRKYGASLEEQMAGLIHDISHYAFSHAIDYILKEGDISKQDLQDRSKEKFLEKSDVPEILEKYGYDTKYIANEENFPLLENSLPDLCADRIEYSLRDIGLFLENGESEAKRILTHLKVKDGNTWYFDNVDIGYEYAEYFKKLNDDLYAGFSSAIMFKSIKDFIKHALQREYICTDDLEQYDQYVLDKCLKYIESDKLLRKYWARMNNRKLFYQDRNNCEEIVSCKSRVVDPRCLVNADIKRISDIHIDWKKTLQMDSTVKEYHIAVRE